MPAPFPDTVRRLLQSLHGTPCFHNPSGAAFWSMYKNQYHRAKTGFYKDESLGFAESGARERAIAAIVLGIPSTVKYQLS